ncbi:hypothetical protein EJ110_NYTH54047 [Nymphaea thermarum]|nr:hypothetical protein EJ110_NYTH54047 [Nymphaea thermarum]
MLGLFVLGCTGVVIFLHGANLLYHFLSSHVAVRSLRGGYRPGPGPACPDAHGRRQLGRPPFPLADGRPATTFPPSRRPRSSSCPVCRHSAASGGRTAGVEQSKP